MSARDSFIAAVRRTIETRGLLKRNDLVLLAVSGGPDSLALLHAFVEIAPEYSLRLHVAHFDHRLREGSGDDARFVEQQAEKLGIGCTVGVAESNEPEPGRSPEEVARTRRLTFFSHLARDLSATRIATGHTLDDQAETVLMRVLVGAGRRGLSGIPPKRWYYIRPLIDVRRAQVEEFCRALGLQPRIDPTNQDPAFLRNQLRTQTLPMLTRTINARLPETLARLADIVREEDYYLDTEASMRAGIEASENPSRLNIEALRGAPKALQRRAIRLLARNEGPGIDHQHTEAVRVLALEAQSGKRLDLPGGLSARVEYGFLVIGPAPSPAGSTSPVTLAVPGETDLLPWGFAVRSWISEQRPAVWPDGKGVCVLDADCVSMPLAARAPKDGDRFNPFGMRGEKKLSDFFTDEKVPREQRGVVVDAKDTIVWVLGQRLDERAKVTARTTRHLWLEIEGGTA